MSTAKNIIEGLENTIGVPNAFGSKDMDYEEVKETPPALRPTGVQFEQEDVEREDGPDFDRDIVAEDLADWEDDSNDM